jgi:hypothetical protein
MFKSKIRPINISQYEHGRLAGRLAAQWGNEQFERPTLDFAAFVAGVALHDWGYGVLDDVPILEASEEAWLAVVSKGIANRFDDATTDIVAKLHIRRLLTLNPSPEREGLIEQIDHLVADRLPETGRTRAAFEWADKITRFCDNVAFDFSFEAPVNRRYPLSPRVGSDSETAVSYQLGQEGDVLVDPWPFSTPVIAGHLIGFRRDGYPDLLRPVLVPYRLHGRAQAA